MERMEMDWTDLQLGSKLQSCLYPTEQGFLLLLLTCINFPYKYWHILLISCTCYFERIHLCWLASHPQNDFVQMLFIVIGKST